MTLRDMKAALAALSLLGAFVFLLRAAQFPSTSYGVAIAASAILPPLVFWLWWNDPTPTMSESIQEARNGAVRRPAKTRD